MNEQALELTTPKRKEAIVRELAGEFVVYDKETKRAHCLNKTAGDVWSLCDGKTTIAGIIEKIGPAQADAVWTAIEQLEKAGLLENAVLASGETNEARRDVLRKMGIAAAIAVPMVASILVPTPAHAAS